MTEGAFERKMREIEKNQGSACSEKIQEKLKRPSFNQKTKIRNNKHSLTEEVSKLQELGFWLMT